jgi:hypothetical protein
VFVVTGSHTDVTVFVPDRAIIGHMLLWYLNSCGLATAFIRGIPGFVMTENINAAI